MKIAIEGSEVTLSEVYSGVSIQTDMGLFRIAQRDGGIEVMLNGKTVWASHEINPSVRPVKYAHRVIPETETFVVLTVKPVSDGWDLTFNADGSLYTTLPRTLCAEAPRVGEEATFDCKPEHNQKGVTVGGRRYLLAR